MMPDALINLKAWTELGAFNNELESTRQSLIAFVDLLAALLDDHLATTTDRRKHQPKRPFECGFRQIADFQQELLHLSLLWFG